MQSASQAVLLVPKTSARHRCRIHVATKPRSSLSCPQKTGSSADRMEMLGMIGCTEELCNCGLHARTELADGHLTSGNSDICVSTMRIGVPARNLGGIQAYGTNQGCCHCYKKTLANNAAPGCCQPQQCPQQQLMQHPCTEMRSARRRGAHMLLRSLWVVLLLQL
jgi:hypothetical protein